MHRTINIPLRVKNLVAKHKTSCPFDIASDLGIELVFHSMSLSVRGFYVICGRKKAIVINSKLNEYEQRITVAHELGHIRLHATKGIRFSASYYLKARISEIEREADIFALCLLGDISDVSAGEIAAYTDPDMTTQSDFRDFVRRHLK